LIYDARVDHFRVRQESPPLVQNMFVEISG